jgi:general secretion pathway protein M
MRAALRKAWASRTLRERRAVAALGVVLLAAGLVWFAQTADHARSRLRPAAPALQGQRARHNQQALEIERLRASPRAAVSQSDLRALVQSQIGAELSRALVRIDAPDPDQVEVVFGAVAFSDWLDWIAGLNAQQVRVATSRIEALSSPGMVSVTATLVRAKPQ